MSRRALAFCGMALSFGNVACADLQGMASEQGPLGAPVAAIEASPFAAKAGAGVAGRTIVYRFPPGRIYQAAYGCEEMSFVLLEPKLPVPPSKTMPYRSRLLRPGLELVVWDDPEFHTTFVIDLDRRELHASALRGGTTAFLGKAEILSIEDNEDFDAEQGACDGGEKAE